MYTVKEMASISNVSIKTLYHYQRIGLLEPATVGENRYRYYGEQEVNRLQIIHGYRAMGLTLGDIKKLLDEKAEESQLLILEQQLIQAKKEQENLSQIVHTLEKTVASLREGIIMKDKEKFEGLYQEDTLSRVLQNLVILFAKPMSFFWLVFGLVLAYYQGSSLFTLRTDNDYPWIISLALALLGIFVVVLSFHNLVRKSTWKMLEDANRRQKSNDK